MLIDILLIVASIILTIITIVTWKYDHWRKYGVPHIKPIFPFGCVNQAIFGRKPIMEQLKEYYDKFRGYKYFGIYLFRNPVLIPRDVELVKCILVKNFNNFKNNAFKTNAKADPYFGLNPFILRDNQWKLVRSQLTPALTPGKIKNMFPSMIEATQRLVNYLKTNPEIRIKMSAKDLATRFTAENVALCGLGINAQSFEDHPKNLKNIATKLFAQDDDWLSYLTFRRYYTYLMYLDPTLIDVLRLKLFRSDIPAFFTNIVQYALKHRSQSNIQTNDYLDYLRQLKEKCTEYEFTDLHIAVHFATLFLDGVETSSITLSNALYEIAANPEVFKKLRLEIDTKLKDFNDEINYTALSEMPYLDSCINEALRKSSPLLWIMKECTEPMTLPPAYNGYQTVTITKGTIILIPIYLLHHDPRYYPDPESFKPERFYNEEKNEKITQELFIPFGDGPRVCLGKNFAIAQLKAAVASIIRNFDICVNKETCPPIPDGPSFMNIPLKQIYLDFYERGEIYGN